MTIHRSPLFPELYFHAIAQETAKAKLAAASEVSNIPQYRIDQMLADEAERECGIRTNISPANMERVAERIASGEGRPTFEHVDYLHTMDVPRPTPEQRESAHAMIERLKETARGLGTRVGFSIGPITRRDAGEGWMYMGTEWHERDLFSVPERLPGKTTIALHVVKHREGPAPQLVGFRVSLDTLLATAEESNR